VVNANNIWIHIRLDNPLQLMLMMARSDRLMQVLFPVVDSVVAEMKRRFLDHEIMKVAKAADVVQMTMSDDDCAIDYFLETYGGTIHVNSALAKAEINTIKYSVDVL
jgi:hypothetical protein